MRAFEQEIIEKIRKLDQTQHQIMNEIQPVSFAFVEWFNERLSCEFWTADERLFNAVRSQLTWVKWIGNFAGYNGFGGMNLTPSEPTVLPPLSTLERGKRAQRAGVRCGQKSYRKADSTKRIRTRNFEFRPPEYA